jgi:Uma2 family endonuclease
MGLVHGDMPVVRIPASATTLEGFREWAKSDEFPQRGRISFLDREIFIDMSAEEYQTHGQLKSEVGRVILNRNKNNPTGLFFPDRTLLTNEEAGLSTEPDGAFVKWKSIDSGKVRLVPRVEGTDRYNELFGAPDWVMEIISDSSVRKDTIRLRDTYYRAGITEYWLIDARGEEIDFQILVRGKDGFVSVPKKRGWQRSRVFGASFRLTRRRDRRSFYQYDLEEQDA